ncbi:MAG: hypothetical protein ACTHL8_11825 [Burkholderiaceae bacterium]
MTSTPSLPGFAAVPAIAASATDSPRPPAPPDRAAAAGMALAAVLSIVFVALDPEVRVRGASAVLQAIAADAPIHQGVHAAESLFVLMLAHGVASLGARLGLARPAVRFGLLAYLAGAFAMLVATTFDGFVTPAIAAAWLRPGHDVQAGLEAIRLAGISVQSFATMSWGLEAVGALALSAALFADGGARRRLGALGLVAAMAPIVALAAAGPAMDTTVVVGILLTQAVWNFAGAAALWRRERA